MISDGGVAIQPQTAHGAAIIGSALGDTLGVPYENGLPARSEDEIRQRGHCWTDDTQQALVLLDDFLRHGNLDFIRVMDRFKQYWRHSEYPHPKGCGLHRGTGRRFREAVGHYVETGELAPRNSSGNGAAMRVGPVAYAMPDTEANLVSIRLVSSCTHGETLGVAAAEAVVLAAWSMRDGLRGDDVLESVAGRISEPRFQQVLRTLIGVPNWRATLESKVGCQAGAAFALAGPISAIVTAAHSQSLLEAARAAVLLGGDTDTTGAMAGALAAGAYGLGALESEWLDFPECQSLLAWDNNHGPVDVDHCLHVETRVSAVRASGR